MKNHYYAAEKLPAFGRRATPGVFPDRPGKKRGEFNT